jgi:hypothetical protein
MTLAPQITNTPIPASTWYVTSDFTVDSTATVQSTTTFTQATAPNASAIGDIWFDTSNGNKQYRWDGSSWVAVQDTAVALASTALQTSANTIVNSSNQLTAINGNGVTVYSGGSATSGARVIFNSAGIAGFNSSGSATFTLDSSNGNVSMTGTVTATSGSIGGWTLSSSRLYNGGSYLDSSGSIYLVGGITTLSPINISPASGYSYINALQSYNYFLYSSYGVTSGWSPSSDNTYYLGLSSYKWKAVYSNTGTIQTSDARQKTNVKDSVLGLDFINSLHPVSYKWIVGSNDPVVDKDGKPVVIGKDENDHEIYQTTEIPGKRVHWGFLAQEVKKAVDKSGVEDFAGWVLDDFANPNSPQGLRYEQFIAPLTKAVQELSVKITTLEGKVNGTAA